MNSLEKKIQNQLFLFLQDQKNFLEDFTPGFCLQVFSKGKLKANLRIGTTHKYYDLASLTKIIFTLPQIMHIFVKEKSAESRLKNTSAQKLKMDSSLRSILPWWPSRLKITLKQLLTHTSGLPWWRPLYKDIQLKNITCQARLGGENCRLSCSEYNCVKEFLKKKVRGFKTIKPGKCIYSDPGFWLLGFVLEEVYESSLLEIWKSYQQERSFSDINFHPHNRSLFSSHLYAPTGKCEWRGRMIQGEVQDRNAWAFGGVSSHSGLFGSIEALAKWALYLRQIYFLKQDPLSSVLRLFSKRALPKEIGHWGLGFMKAGNPFGGGGHHLSQSSIGHTGYTGTSFWFDPKKDVVVLLLSNRTHKAQKPFSAQKSSCKNTKTKHLETKNTMLSEDKTEDKRDNVKKNVDDKENEEEVNVYETFETGRVQKMKKKPFSSLRNQIHNIVFESLSC